MITKKLKSFKNRIKNFFTRKKGYITDDRVAVRLPGLEIIMDRKSDLSTPHEVTVVVPRAEIRHRYYEEENYRETELLYSSITVVSAPRHPLAGPPEPPPDIPPGEED